MMENTRENNVILFPVKGIPESFVHRINDTLEHIQEKVGEASMPAGGELMLKEERGLEKKTALRVEKSNQLNELSEDELDIMILLWTQVPDKPLTKKELLVLLKNEGFEAASSLMILLTRLVRSGYLEKVHIDESERYRIIIPYERYAKYIAQASFGQWGCETILDIVSKLFDAKMIDTEDLADLKCYISAVESRVEEP